MIKSHNFSEIIGETQYFSNNFDEITIFLAVLEGGGYVFHGGGSGGGGYFHFDHSTPLYFNTTCPNISQARTGYPRILSGTSHITPHSSSKSFSLTSVAV